MGSRVKPGMTREERSRVKPGMTISALKNLTNPRTYFIIVFKLPLSVLVLPARGGLLLWCNMFVASRTNVQCDLWKEIVMTTPHQASSSPPSSVMLPVYARADVAFERGEGVWLVASDGSRYLDFGAGVAVNALGHAHPHLVEVLTAQAQ